MKKHLASTTHYQKKQIYQTMTILKNYFIDDDGANKIRKRLNNSLKIGCLDLSDCQISDEILSQILPLLSVLNIKELNLRHNQIGPSGAKALAETLKTNTSLQEIYLSFNNFGDLSDRLLNSLENG